MIRSIPTPCDLRRSRRRLDRRAAAAGAVIAAMENGAALVMHHANGRQVWRLDPGGAVAKEAARRVLLDPRIHGQGDSLSGALSQSWRFAGGAS